MKKAYLPTIYILTLAIVCAVVFWAVLHSREVGRISSAGYIDMSGLRAPEFQISSLDGKPFTTKDLKKPLLLEIFASWCPECRAEVAALNKIATTRSDITVLAITGDSRGQTYQVESVHDLQNYVRRNAVKYNIAYDPTLQIARQYQTSAFPNIVIIGTDGVIVYNRVGLEPYNDIDKAVDAAVSHDAGR